MSDSFLYYSIDINNPTSQPIPAVYQDSRTVPLLDRCSNYEMSIVRIYAPVSSIPLMLWPGDTTYSVTFSYGGTSYTTFLQYANLLGLTQPAIFRIYDFLQMLNSALATAFAACKNGSGSLAGNTKPPFFTYSPSTQLLSLNVETAYDDSVAPGTMTFGVNQALYQLLTPFQYLSDGTFTSYMFSIPPNPQGQAPAALYPVAGGSYDGYSIPAEWNNLANWSSLQSIYMQTMVPISGEAIRPLIQTGSGSNSIPILQSFEPDMTNPSGTRDVLQYIPAQYRYIDMLSDSPLVRFDLQIFWTDKLQNSYPLMLLPGQLFTVKVMFSRKEEEPSTASSLSGSGMGKKRKY